MHITISDSLETILNDLGSTGGIQASALVSKDGLMMASNINKGNFDKKALGAVVAMLTRSAVHTAKELNKGEIEYLLLNTRSGQIIVTKVVSNTILAVLTDTDINITSTVREMKRACKEIKNVFAQV